MFLLPLPLFLSQAAASSAADWMTEGKKQKLRSKRKKILTVQSQRQRCSATQQYTHYTHVWASHSHIFAYSTHSPSQAIVILFLFSKTVKQSQPTLPLLFISDHFTPKSNHFHRHPSPRVQFPVPLPSFCLYSFIFIHARIHFLILTWKRLSYPSSSAFLQSRALQAITISIFILQCSRDLSAVCLLCIRPLITLTRRYN